MTDRPGSLPLQAPPAAPSSEPRVICSGLSCAHLHDKACVYLRPRHRRARLCPGIRLPRQLRAASRARLHCPSELCHRVCRAERDGGGGVGWLLWPGRGCFRFGTGRTRSLATGSRRPEGFLKEAEAPGWCWEGASAEAGVQALVIPGHRRGCARASFGASERLKPKSGPFYQAAPGPSPYLADAAG